MAKWSEAKITRACNLWAARWSVGAIATAFDMKPHSIRAKFNRMRKADEIRIQMADLTRAIAKASGVREIDADAIAKLKTEEGFAAGLRTVLELDAA